MQIPVNCFNFLEFKKLYTKINDVKKYDVYLYGKNIDKILVAEVDININKKHDSILKIKNRGFLIHPKVLLTLNYFIFNYDQFR